MAAPVPLTEERTLLVRALASGRVAGYAAGAATAAALVVGIPTRVIPNPLFTRMTPVRPLDYVFLAATVLLAAALGGAYALPAACPRQDGKLTVGGLLSVLAIGCPICNKLVVLALGVSGALTSFQPVQPVLGVLSLALLGVALVVRFRAVRAALVRPRAPAPTPVAR